MDTLANDVLSSVLSFAIVRVANVCALLLVCKKWNADLVSSALRNLAISISDTDTFRQFSVKNWCQVPITWKRAFHRVMVTAKASHVQMLVNHHFPGKLAKICIRTFDVATHLDLSSVRTSKLVWDAKSRRPTQLHPEVTHLSIIAPPWCFFVPCPNVQVLTIDFRDSHSKGQAFFDATTFPRVRKLIISCDWWWLDELAMLITRAKTVTIDGFNGEEMGMSVCSYIAKLETPALFCELQCNTDFFTQLAPIGHKLQLRKLRISNFCDPPCISCLQKFPTLRTLHASYYEHTNFSRRLHMICPAVKHYGTKHCYSHDKLRLRYAVKHLRTIH
jgi:hypothetical protein